MSISSRMKSVLPAFLALALCLLLESISFAQGTGQPPTPSTSTDSALDLGEIKGSIYRNQYFGVSFTVPKGWTILDVGVMKAGRDNAKDLFRGERDANLKRGLEASIERTTPLISLSKFPPGTKGVFHAVLLCAAERIPTAVVKTPRDFYTLLLNSFRLSQEVDVEVVEPFKEKKIGAANFGTYELKVTSNVGVIMQKHIVMIKSQYAFAIVLNYTDEGDADAFNEAVNSINAN